MLVVILKYLHPTTVGRWRSGRFDIAAQTTSRTALSQDTSTLAGDMRECVSKNSILHPLPVQRRPVAWLPASRKSNQTIDQVILLGCEKGSFISPSCKLNSTRSSGNFGWANLGISRCLHTLHPSLRDDMYSVQYLLCR